MKNNFISRFFSIKIFIACIAILLSYSWGQSFKVSVERTTVAQNENFQVDFTASLEGNDRVTNFRQPDFKDFVVLSGPNSQTSMSIINGKVSSTNTFSYIVTCSNIGEFTIGSASVDIAGKNYKTSPLKITVQKGSPRQQQAGNQQAGATNQDLSKSIFLRAIANKTQAYKGEQINLSYKLYYKFRVDSYDIIKQPGYNGFWAEELDGSGKITTQTEMYNGERFNVSELKKVALFPSKDGKLSVSPFEVKMRVLLQKRATKNDPFEDFFNSSMFNRVETVDFVTKSNELAIDVLPLPETNKPASFNGAVGSYTLSASLDKNKTKTNEAITLKYVLKGTGNIKLMNLPQIELPAGFEQYEPKLSENINKAGLINGTKTIEYLLVPRIEGEKIIKPIQFAYFDPSKRQYFNITTPELTVFVERGTGVYEPINNGVSKEDVKLLNQDIRFINTSDTKLNKREDFELLSGWFWFSIIFPSVALLSIIFVKRRQDKLSGDVQLLKFKRAQKISRDRLKSAKKALDAGALEKYYTEISSGVFGYLEDKLNINKFEFTVNRAVESLIAGGVEAELADRVKVLIEKCEFARFAPGDPSKIASDIYIDAVEIVAKLENTISVKGRK